MPGGESLTATWRKKCIWHSTRQGHSPRKQGERNIMLKYYLHIRNWFEREEGQDLIEYALLVVLIAVVAYAGMQGIGAQIGAIFIQIGGFLGIVPPVEG